MTNKLSRIDLYLQSSVGQTYVNTEKEQELVNKFDELYNLAKSAQDNNELCSPSNLDKWRRAYKGTLNALKQDGTESPRRSRQLRKMVYELIESKVDNSIPMPKIQPRYKTDIPLVNITENYLKFEVDRTLTKFDNDRSERSTYVDGTSWYKVWWDSLENSHARSGNVRIGLRTVDQIVPQPGVIDYKQLEYIFEREEISTTRIYDLYGRMITPTKSDTNLVEVISCYYLNSDRIVGLFMWCPTTMQVICNEEDWQIRKIRVCTSCDQIVPQSDTCPICGNKHFKYKNAETDILSEDLYMVYNPYDVGETNDPTRKDEVATQVFLTAGTEVPFYKLRQLPFVPRPAVSSLDSIYGISEAGTILDMQDASNKILTKAFDKTMKSGAVVTKPEKMKLGDMDETFKLFGVRSAEEAQMVQTKQIVADTSQDMMIASMLYESAKSTSGVTDSFQGKKDTTASSGKAKQFAAMQSAGRIESLRIMKSAAFSGLYELVFKYLLAFSDETRKFTRILPDGKQQEECWNKYMFLAKDKYGEIYYRDDFHFDSDPASTLSQNRVQMWQETLEKFTMGTFGNPSDPRTLELFWNIMDSLQYPLAKVVLAGIKDNSEHLPAEIEQALMQNPELMQIVMQTLKGDQENRGGARPNSGPQGNGATHSANVERTNERNRAQNKQQAFSAQQASEQGGVA